MKTIKKPLMLLLFSLWHLTTLKAQLFDENNSSFMGSPNLTGSYTEPTVQEASGLASVGVPMFTIAADGYQDKVSISYNTSGIRVDEYGSRVGLGWNLQAGGSITRVVCGLPDDDPVKGILRPGGAAFPYYETNQNMLDIYQGKIDGEYDYYVLQAGPLYAKFYYNGTNFFCMPASGIKIENGTFLGISNSYKVTDLQGIQYFFTIQETVSVSSNKTTFQVSDRVYSWLLTKVLLPNQTAIQYQYKSTQEYWVYAGKSERAIHVKHPTFLDNQNLVGDVKTNGSYVTTDRWQYFKVHPIEQITWDFGKINFYYSSTSRTDIIGDYALSSVTYKTSNNFFAKRFNFSYGTSNRLMLQSVQEVINETSLMPPYSFEYNAGVLPAVGSFSQDRYGYYNAENADGLAEIGSGTDPHPTMLPNHTYDARITGTAGVETITLPGATRYVSSTFQKYMSLKKITFPTGATREFFLEPNRFIKAGQSAEQDGPGMRVSKIADDDGNGNKKYKKYTYQNGVFFDVKRYLIYESHHGPSAFGYVGNTLYSSAPNQRVIYRFSDPASLMPSLFPQQVFYAKVISEEVDAEGNNLNGSIENEFYANPLEFYDEPIYSSTATTPTAILISNHVYYGTLKKSTLKVKTATAVTAADYRIVKETFYDYNFNEPTPTNKYVFALYARPINPNAGQMYLYDAPPTASNGTGEIGIHKYFYRSIPFYLTKVTTKEYGTIGASYNLSQTEYTYEPSASIKHFLPVKVKQTLGDGTTLTKFITRAADLNGFGSSHAPLQAIEQLKLNNQLGVEIESYTIKNFGTSNEVLLGSNLKEFKKASATSALVIPEKEYALKQNLPVSSFVPCSAGSGAFTKSAAYKLVSQGLEANASGTTLSINTLTDISSILLNPSGEFKLATAQHATFGEIAYLGFEWYETEGAANVNAGVNTIGYGKFKLNYSGSFPMASSSFAGSKGLQLGSATSITNNTSLALITGKKYQLSVWSKDGTVSLMHAGTSITGTILQTTNGWNLIQYTFVASSSNIEITGTAMVDEIKLMPIEAEWSSSVYDEYGRTSCEADNNHNYIFYQYDAFGRLWRVLDMDKNILKQQTIQLQQSQN